MVKLSGVIITFNEEKNIERCITSLIDVVDEIIILDSFSTDKTKEICKGFNVKFYQSEFDGYTKQKNRAIEFAENDFVLSLDADELLSDELKNSILRVKDNPQFNAYDFNRLNFYCGKPIRRTGWYPDRKIRLWNKKKGEWSGDLIHEVVKMDEKNDVKFLKGDLLHFSFNTIEEHVSQINKFSTIKAISAFNRNEKTNIVKILFKPGIKFIIQYIIKLGFLDGFYGFVICKNSVHSEFLKQIKLRQFYKDAKTK